MKRKCNYRLIKNNEIYTIKELSSLLKIHARTIQRFVKNEGLNIINPDSSPFLIKGIDAKRFFQQRIKNQKYTLKYYEFNCFHCNKPVESVPEEIEFVFTDKKLGKSSTKVDIRGICKLCGSKLYRLSSDKKIGLIENYYLNKLVSNETSSGITNIQITI